MINPQLLDFIKQQLIKGVNKETITSELVGNGWDEKDIQEGFNAVGVQVQAPQVTPVFPDNKIIVSSTDKALNIDLKQKTKKTLNKETILIVILIIWIGLEVVNYFEYKAEKVNWDQDQAEFGVLTYGMPIHRPSYNLMIINIIYSMFPNTNHNSGLTAKPVLYLYPTQTENVKVELDFNGKLVADYPTYDYSQKGWNVTAYPDGKIINKDGKEYSYLFWEGIPKTPIDYDLSTGFVVKGKDTVAFLQDTLSRMGLTPKEYNEFIVYWYPKMKDNKYNLIHFADKQYTDTAPLTIIPKPDSMLRVFMVFKPLDRAVEVKPQEIKSFSRTGFLVIEWGGIEL